MERRRAIPPDYDERPGRFRLARELVHRHSRRADVHEQVASRLLAEGLTPVLDVGCGEGELARHLPAGAWVGLDGSAELLAAAPEPHVLGDACALRLADGSFGSVALLYVLYHLPEPARALAEAHRVLRAGGLVAVAAPSRHDSPELAHAFERAPLTFDAELAEELLSAAGFVELDVQRWDAPLVELPDAAAVRDYLLGRCVPAERADAVAVATAVPLTVTKRGALAFGRKLS